MGGGGKGGNSDASGMYMAMASAAAADKAYQLGEQQFQWSKDVWTQEQPIYDAAQKAQMDMYEKMAASTDQMTQESKQQWQMYLDTYAPLEKTLAAQAENWASPENTALVRGQAMGSIAEQGQSALNAAANTLRGYGVDPSSGRYAGLYATAQPMLGAAQAAAGTTATQNLKLQQLGLESGVVNTGRGLVSATGQLAQTGTGAAGTGAGAASGAGNTATSNIGSTAVGAGATSNLFNAGANNMNAYVNAVNGYNQSQAEFAQASASEMGGLGSALGSLTGLAWMGMKSDEREKTDIKREGTEPRTGIPLYSFRYKEDPKSYPKVVGPMAQDVERIAPHLVGAIPGSRTKMVRAFQDGGEVSGAIPMDPSIGDPQLTPRQGGGTTGIPSQPIPPGGTPGGGVPDYASPSMGQQTDDVPAQLTAGEFVIPKDVAMWKGHEYFVKQIDAARRGQEQLSQRDDIGGEPTGAIPQQPNFISRPQHMGAMIPGGMQPYSQG